MEGIVTADLGVSQTPALLIGFYKRGLLVGQDMADDHGGASNECCLKEEGERQLDTVLPALKPLVWGDTVLSMHPEQPWRL